MELPCWLNKHRSNLSVQSDQVPALSEVAVEVLRMAQQAEPCMEEHSRVVRMNAAIAARIMQFPKSPSPLFEIRRTAATSESAVVLPGTTMIRTLVLGFTPVEQGPSDGSLRSHF